MKAQHIQTLVAIADAGSLRGAAELVGKSQPALTKSLRQAEEDLGITIFQRSSRGVVPTHLGERVLSRARAIASEMGRLNDEIAQLRGEQVGRIHVCVSPLAAVKIVPHALAWFHKDHPNIEVHLTSGLFPNALKPLRDGKIDMVIGPSPPTEIAREIKVEPLLSTPVVVITSQTSPYRKVSSLSELTDAPWIMIGAPQGPGDVFRNLFLSSGLTPPSASTTSESYFGAMSLVESLGAVCTFPLRLLEDVQRGWEVAEIPIKETLEPIEIALMTRSALPLTPLAESLANCVRKRVAELQRADYP